MKRFYLVLFAFLLSWQVGAVVRDTAKTANLNYADELGFFQKANRELTDPRFMFKDDKTGVEFGIGGTVQVSAAYTFCGVVENYNFIPSLIGVPQDNIGSFGLKIHGTEFHFKSRAQVKGHKVLAFVKIGMNSEYKVELKQAYVSFDGFSIGMIPSFFNDLEYGVMTQSSVNTQIDKTQPLVGYTYKSNGWEFALAAEKADFNLLDYGFADLDSDFQNVPDFTGHIKRRWENGHIQLGGVFRCMNYWSRTEEEKQLSLGKSFYEIGYGFSLSGNYKPTSKLKFAAAAVGGYGIQKYMDVYSSCHLEVAKTDKIVDKHYTIDAVPACSFGLAAQYNWTKSLSSSVVGSYAKIFRKDKYQYYSDNKYDFHVETNLYWTLDEYGYMGLAYFYGRNTVFADMEGGNSLSGHANRIMFIITYLF